MIEPTADPTWVEMPNQNRLRFPRPICILKMDAMLTLTYVSTPIHTIHVVIYYQRHSFNWFLHYCYAQLTIKASPVAVPTRGGSGLNAARVMM